MQILGKFKYTLYQNEKYGITIAQYKTEEGRITVTGTNLPSNTNLTYLFSGDWVTHHKYGKQFRATGYEEVVGKDEDSMITYLSTSINGIGKKLAERIVDRFKEETLDILDNRPDDLLKIKGVSEKKLNKIKESIMSSRAARETIMELSQHGISPRIAMDVYRHFQSGTMDVIKNSPYLLCSIPGITFPTADALGNRTPEYEQEYKRFVACAGYVLYANEKAAFNNIVGRRASGSTGMDKDDFGKVMLSMLRVSTIDGTFILDNTIRMIKEGKLVYKKIDDKHLLFLPGIYRIEEALAQHLSRLFASASHIVYDIDDKINAAEKALGLELGVEQKKAVREAFSNNLSLIIGPPGAGKTTTIQVIAYIYKEEYGNDMRFMAPSARAAVRIRESSGYHATTIHSFVNIGVDVISDLVKEEYILDSGLVIVDEMSMVDVRTAYQLFSSLGSDCMVVLCGDDEQLPSVNAGAVLRDLIDSGVIPTTVLSTIYRQDKGSHVRMNAYKIRKGETDLAYGEDFSIKETSDTKEMETGMIRSYIEKTRQYGIENVMLLSPFKEHDAGVLVLNKRIQEYINPPAIGRAEFMYGSKLFRIGDVVMQLKNNAEDDVVNGDIGVVLEICKEDDESYMEVKFPTGNVLYTKDNIDELTLAYAYTIHKAQGGEARAVIICCHSMHSLMLKRDVFYTAFTRARETVEIWGEKNAVMKAIRTQDKTERFTALKMQLKLKFGEFLPL